MILICIAVLAAAVLLFGCARKPGVNTSPAQTTEDQGNSAPETNAPGNSASGNSAPGNKPRRDPVPGIKAVGQKTTDGIYAVKTVLREMTEVDPEKGIGVYGRYTELTTEGDVPEALSRTIAEVNARAKENVESRAARFLAENDLPPRAANADGTDHFRYRNISCIVNVTRADNVLFSILETEMDSGLGSTAKDRVSETQSCRFRSSIYETQSGRLLTPEDFLKDPGSLPKRLDEALRNKYAQEGLYDGGASAGAGASKGGASKGGASAGGGASSSGGGTPAWTADYLGLRFYFDGDMIPEEKKRSENMYYGNKAVHVSIPYTALDGPMAQAAAETPECFIAQLEKNTEYALPHDKRTIRIEKADGSGGNLSYQIVIRDGKNEKAWWLEYADDNSDYYVFRAQGAYYFYRLDDTQDRAYVYNFASPDGGFDRFENQNAQCFDSFLHELFLAVPYDPECAHMRERSRQFMNAASDLNTYFTPAGHYFFLPEKGRGRTWLHFALVDDTLSLDSRNVGCRLLHEISAVALDKDGNEGAEITVPAGEVLRFLRLDGESELYYYMSAEYNKYHSGARDYLYDCALADGSLVRLVTSYENSFFVDGMYMDRIGEPVTLGAAQYESGLEAPPEHYVEIGGKQYQLIRDLSLKSESGEEIDFGGDVWWIVENYVGTFTAAKDAAGTGTSGNMGFGMSGAMGSSTSGTFGSGTPAGTKLVISENGDVSFEYAGSVFKGKLPEKRYYRQDVMISLESELERRTFQIIVMDGLPPNDPSFRKIRLWSEGEPATNEPSRVPPIEADLIREAGT